MQKDFSFFRRITKRSVLLLIIVLSLGFAVRAQENITGPSCIVSGTQYSYLLAGAAPSFSYTITNGTLSTGGNSGSSSSNSQTILITWNNSSGSISMTSMYPTTVYNVGVAPALSPGGIGAGLTQFVYSGSVPAAINCTVATGGNCAGSYTYQWQQSTDAITYTNITGATGQNITFTTGITQKTYYRRMVNSSGTIAYSNVANATVQVPLVTGHLTNVPQTINYNTSFATIGVTGYSGGTNNYGFQWFNSVDGTTFTSIPSATSSTYSAAITTTTYYQVMILSGTQLVYSNVGVINVTPPFAPGIISPQKIALDSGNNPGFITCSPATGGTCGGSYSYQWQSSTNDTTFTSILGETDPIFQPSSIASTIYYRRQTTCGSNVLYTDTCQVVLNYGMTDLSFIRTRTYSKPGIIDSATASGLTSISDVQQVTEYFDGIGRVVQSVSKQITPLGNDFVSFNIYDAEGRESQKYMPYSASASTDGNYKFSTWAVQANFNYVNFPNDYFYYYAQTVFEPSPLNRVQGNYAPGVNWVGSNRGVTNQYLFNTASDSVKYWVIASAPGSIPTSSRSYAAGTLAKNVTTDESGHTVVQYQDLQGKVVLKKVQSVALPGGGHVGWLSTYYVYDDLDNLRFVIPPKAVDLLEANGTWSLTSLTNLTNELCFRYEYDYRKRMIIKKIPGAGEEWMVYDGRDRVVMTQDSNLRNTKWMVVKYDNENRSDSTGLLTDANTRSYHQNLSENNSYYPNTSSNFELLTQTYYDGYSWASAIGLTGTFLTTYTTSSTYFNTTYNASPTYANPIAVYPEYRGLITGSQVKVLNTSSQFLPSVSFYDDHGRIIESQSINQTTGKDTVINQYDFSGRVLRNLVRHQKSGGSGNIQTHSVLTKSSYDGMGRLLTVSKNIDNATSDQLISTLSYNELSQLQTKKFGNGIDSLVYNYNIRGWLINVNKQFLPVTNRNKYYFAEELSYDKTLSVTSTNYAMAQYNGNISGIMWKTNGDNTARKYDFSYDYTNRLTSADFNQNDEFSFDKSDGIDFSVSNLSYDGNGNIMSMNQEGFTVGGSALIDQLKYSYQTNSNKLSQVVDSANNPTSKLGDFHYAGTKLVPDYAYDGNGNDISDSNKAISKIIYNYLNLPQQLNVKSKGTVSYTYDAGGKKLYKITVDSTVSPVKTTQTTYIGGFIYQATSPPTGGAVTIDTLQMIGHEEGRARWAFHKTLLTGTIWYGYEYDFFEKDHLGDTRVILTQQKDTSGYLASGESVYRATESQLFENLTTTVVSRTSAGGYPNDVTVTNPNDSVFKVSGETGGHKTGPSLLLKVMSGDVFDLSVQSYYNSGTMAAPNNSLTDVIGSLATGLVNVAAGTKGSLTDLDNNTSGPIFNALNNFLTNDSTPTSKPKAYLNWILLDDQLRYVSDCSGAMVVGAASVLNTLANTGISIKRNGFLYIWVSNETPNWNVYFDNLKVKHYTGPELEETHYYPFGLTMSAISDKALKTKYVVNNFKFNKETELQNQEFSDGSGLELYETPLRGLDPQLGRWWQIDSKPNESESPYSAMNNNPIRFNDPLGDTLVFPGASQEFTDQFYDAYSALDAAGVGDVLTGLQNVQANVKVEEWNSMENELPSHFDPETNTIYWDPVSGAAFDDGITVSPATILDHEASHGLQFNNNPEQYAKDRDAKTGADKEYKTKEERRVITKREQRVARALHETKIDQVTRRNHRGYTVPVKNPTSTKPLKGQDMINRLEDLRNKREKKDPKPERKTPCLGCDGPCCNIDKNKLED